MNATEIRALAVHMARTDGLINISRAGLCAAAEISDGSFPHIMGTTFTAFIESLRSDPAVQSAPPTTSVTKTRVSPELRREHILESAVSVARKYGYRKITRSLIAEEAGVSSALVNRYFNTMNQIRQAVMRRAVQLEIPEIVAQGLADRDAQALKAPEGLKRRALETLAG